MEEELNKLIKEAEELLEKKQNNDVIALLNDEILEKYKSSTLYYWESKGISYNT
jgi:hypothetical protein